MRAGHRIYVSPPRDNAWESIVAGQKGDVVYGDRFNRVVEVMALMAAGDRAAVISLYYEFGDQIGAAVRRHLRAMGIERVQSDELDGLVIDACWELESCAAAWSPTGGALPWNWAARRLRNLVARHIGPYADELDETRLEAVAVDEVRAAAATAAAEPEELDVLAALAAIDDNCALLQEALAKVTTPRNRTLVLEVKVQAGLGDPSPALTVGRRHGMRPEAVRQAVKRTLDGLRELAESDIRYANLACLSFLD